MARHFPTIGLAYAVLALGACATSTQVPVEGAASSGSPTPAAGYDWLLSEEAGEARLAFGHPESDDLALALACTPGTGRIDLSQVSDGAATEIHLESGGETERFPATAEPSEIHQGSFLTAYATTDAPVFQRFRQVGWIAVWHTNRRATLTPQPASVGRIERFFILCG